MSNEASENQDQTTTQTDAGQQSQAAETGADQGQEQQGGEGQAQQESAKQQIPSTIPYERFSEKAREAAELKRVNAQLLQALQGQQGGRPQQPRNEDPEPQESAFADFNTFIREQAKWEGRQASRAEFARLQQEQAQQQQYREAAMTQQQAAQNWFSKTAAEDAAFHDAAQNLPLGGKLWNRIMKLENPVPITKHFIANPTEAHRISLLTGDDQIEAFGELRAKLAGAGGQPQPKVTQMPKPMTPVGSGKGTGGEGSGLDKALRILYPT